jgi:hypothetical protein
MARWASAAGTTPTGQGSSCQSCEKDLGHRGVLAGRRSTCEHLLAIARENDAGGKTTNEAEALEDRPRRCRLGILRAPKTWTLKKLGAALISRVAVLLEFVLAVTAASMPIVTLAINGQGRR